MRETGRRDDRRLVAERLRTGGEVSGAGPFLDAIAFSLPPLPGRTNLTTNETDILRQLADIIDPTFEMRYAPVRDGYARTRFACTRCGAWFDDYQTTDGRDHWSDFRYCPSCGARVVGADD